MYAQFIIYKYNTIKECLVLLMNFESTRYLSFNNSRWKNLNKNHYKHFLYNIVYVEILSKKQKQ